jgi:hypothetical protein
MADMAEYVRIVQEALNAPAEGAEPAPPAPPAPPPEEKPAPAPDDAEDGGDEDVAIPAALDPKDAASLEQLQKERAASKESIRAELEEARKERAAAAAELARLSELRPQIDEWRDAQALAEIDPAAVLEALGIKDFDRAAQAVFLRSKKAQEDPRYRAAIEQHQALVAQRREVHQIRKRMDATDTTLQTRSVQEQIHAFIESAAGAASDATPHVKRLLEARPERGRAELHKAGIAFIEEHGRSPTPAEVATYLNQQIEEDRQLFGAPPSTDTKQENPVTADEKKTAQPTPATPAPTTTESQPPRRLTPEEKRAAWIKQVAADLGQQR